MMSGVQGMLWMACPIISGVINVMPRSVTWKPRAAACFKPVREYPVPPQKRGNDVFAEIMA